MSSRPLERRRRSRQIAPRDAHQRERAERRGDRRAPGPDGEQVTVANLARRTARHCRGERRRGPRAERRIARHHGPRDVQDRRRAQVDRQRRKPPQRAVRRQSRRAHAGTRAATVGRGRDNARVTFTRIAWLVTVLACVVTGVALLLSGYVGYAAVFGAVGACAAINLR